MPYILSENRFRYNSLIKNVLNEICKDKDKELDLLKNFINFLVSNYKFENCQCNPNDLDHQEIEKISIELVNRIKSSSEDLFSQAGDFNYILSSVIWSYIGENARYGVRAYIRSMIMGHIAPGLLFEKKQEIIRGVLGDVLDELYRRRTADYEDKKIKENGDVLPLNF